jgi:RNA polymerase sigma factor (TIGR02999 family)
MTVARHPPSVITGLLASIRKGDDGARARLLELVERDLRRIAAAHMNRERPGHILQATALVNELYLRLFSDQRLAANDRHHFYKLVSKGMRQVLLDHARRRDAGKRGSGGKQVTLDERLLIADASPETHIALHEALDALARQDERQAHIMELHCIEDQSTAEIARIYGVTERTVQREIKTARLFIRRHLSNT